MGYPARFRHTNTFSFNQFLKVSAREEIILLENFSVNIICEIEEFLSATYLRWI